MKVLLVLLVVLAVSFALFYPEEEISLTKNQVYSAHRPYKQPKQTRTIICYKRPHRLLNRPEFVEIDPVPMILQNMRDRLNQLAKEHSITNKIQHNTPSNYSHGNTSVLPVQNYTQDTLPLHHAITTTTPTASTAVLEKNASVRPTTTRIPHNTITKTPQTITNIPPKINRIPTTINKFPAKTTRITPIENKSQSTTAKILPINTKILPTTTSNPPTITRNPPTNFRIPPKTTRIPPTITRIPPTTTVTPSTTNSDDEDYMNYSGERP